MLKKNFASDNWASVHPTILQALIDANTYQVPAYGSDTITAQAQEKLKEYFGPDIDAYFVFNGTAANVLGMQTALKPYQAVLCATSAHINTDECGALEYITGSKIIPLLSSNGKVTSQLVEPYLQQRNNQHQVQPKVISVSQLTELGTLYTPEELRALTLFAHNNGLLVHMDGARIANAAAALNCSLADITTNVGIDILSMGGTKNGMMYGEAVIFFDKTLSQEFKYIHKQGMQLASKMRFIAAQFLALLSHNLWLTNATHANSMAQLLKQELNSLQQVDFANELYANALFAKIPPQAIEELQKEFSFYVWNKATHEVRWMTSFDTTQEEVLYFAQRIKEVCQSLR